MFLEAKVQVANVDEQFYSGVSAIVLDRGTKTFEKYNVSIVGGLDGVEELRQLQKMKVSEQERDIVIAGVHVPAEDEILPLDVVKMRNKNGFLTLVCRVAQSA